ncbi:MAG TPA: DUF3710 domain-containing protein [Pseudonocardia sp.]|nr:DUF3710 domain-containing protein [Pseudonocardia sp.]
MRVATEGPYDSEDPAVARLGKTAGRVDFGSLRIPIPARAQLQVEKGTGELLRAVHVLVPSGRVSLSALAAPRSNPLWRGLSGEIAESLSGDGARVRTQWGEWGREVEAGSNGALSRFIGVDGPRWMLYGVATGPADGAEELADVLREMMRKTVVYRGPDPLPVKTVLPLRLPEHLEENVERARDVSAQRPAGARRPERAERPGPDGSGPDRPARSGRPAGRGVAARAIGSPGGDEAELKTPRRPADPPVRRPDRPAAEAPPPGRRPVPPPMAPPNGAPRTGQAPGGSGRAIGRPVPSGPPPGSVPAAAQLPPFGPAIGPLGGAGRPVDRPPAAPAGSPPGYRGPHADINGAGRPGHFSGELPRVSGYPNTDGGGRFGVGPAVAGALPGHTDPGGLPRHPVSGHTDGRGIGDGGATPAYGSLPPISGRTDTGGLPRTPGIESTWSLAMPVVNTDQVSQQPAWALLGDAPSFWPDERYRPGSPEDGPVEMSSIDSSLPLEPVFRWAGQDGPASTVRDGLDSSSASDPWLPVDTGYGRGERPVSPSWSESGSRPEQDSRPEPGSWSSPADDLLSSTDSLHAVLTHDEAVTRDRRTRADRLGRHRSTDV